MPRGAMVSDEFLLEIPFVSANNGEVDCTCDTVASPPQFLTIPRALAGLPVGFHPSIAPQPDPSANSAFSLTSYQCQDQGLATLAHAHALPALHRSAIRISSSTPLLVSVAFHARTSPPPISQPLALPVLNCNLTPYSFLRSGPKAPAIDPRSPMSHSVELAPVE